MQAISYLLKTDLIAIPLQNELRYIVQGYRSLSSIYYYLYEHRLQLVLILQI